MITNKGAELMYNAAIVAAAEAFVDEAPINRHFAAASVVRILDAVEAKRAALRPKCEHPVFTSVEIGSTQGPCGQPAVQRVYGPGLARGVNRCAKHKVTVTDL